MHESHDILQVLKNTKSYVSAYYYIFYNILQLTEHTKIIHNHVIEHFTEKKFITLDSDLNIQKLLIFQAQKCAKHMYLELDTKTWFCRV